jgi:hypothetical protein
MRNIFFLPIIFLTLNLNAQSISISNNLSKVNSKISEYGFSHSVGTENFISTYLGTYNNYCNLVSYSLPLKLAVNSGPAAVIYSIDNVTHVNYTAFGSNAPLIKTKLITGITSGADGSSISSAVAHGIADYTKILAVNVEVFVPAFSLTPARTFPEEYTYASGYQVSYFVNGAGVSVINSIGNSFNVRNMPFKVFITYEQ